MDDSLKYLDADIDDRAKVLEETANTGIIKSLMGGEFPVNEPDLEIYYTNPYLSIPNYDETEKFGIIYTSKGGSSLIRGVLTKYDIADVSLFGETDWFRTYRNLIAPIRNEKYYNKEYSGLVSICDGKSTKDLILVIRNPIYKWLSGLVMDVKSEVNQSKLLFNLIKEKYSLSDSVKDITPEALADITYHHLKSNLKEGLTISESHAALYNESHYNFLLCNNIDLNKLRIIDIDDPDSDLLGLLQSYYPIIQHDASTKSFWTQRGYHSAIINGLISAIADNKDIILSSIIKQTISRDFYYYNLLKNKFKDNIAK